MWPDLRKGVFHTHPVYQLWWFITLDWYKLLTWNLVRSTCQHTLMTRGSFSSIFHSIPKLWSSKFGELDVCGRPLFANPVTYMFWVLRLHGQYWTDAKRLNVWNVSNNYKHLRLTTCDKKKKLNLSFEVGYLDLETAGMDFLHCFCGSY